jgi:hypothetical protein
MRRCSQGLGTWMSGDPENWDSQLAAESMELTYRLLSSVRFGFMYGKQWGMNR